MDVLLAPLPVSIHVKLWELVEAYEKATGEDALGLPSLFVHEDSKYAGVCLQELESCVISESDEWLSQYSPVLGSATVGESPEAVPLGGPLEAEYLLEACALHMLNAVASEQYFGESIVLVGEAG